ncbi:MAG: hypothetical protein GY855_17645 [candidate division Zixibacteria bacterium]|nr:hypothetical protein [candidate division Zixibacteria bacterium]
MNSDPQLIERLKLKLEYSTEYGNILDDQYDAIKNENSEILGSLINSMDEYHVRLMDIDRLLKNEGVDIFPEDFMKSTEQDTDPQLMGYILKIRDVVRQNIEKISRNQNIARQKHDILQNSIKDLHKTTQLKKYFEGINSGEFLNFSG